MSLVIILIVAPEDRKWLFAVLLILTIVVELVFYRKVATGRKDWILSLGSSCDSHRVRHLNTSINPVI